MIEFQKQKHGFAIAEASQCLFNPLYDSVIARTKDGKLLGGVIFYDFTGKSVSIHMAGFDPHWVNRDMLWVVFHYAFVQLGCSYIFCQVRSLNRKALKMVKNIGFKREVVIPDVFADGDLEVYRMRKETCRWLKLVPRGITSGGNMMRSALQVGG